MNLQSLKAARRQALLLVRATWVKAVPQKLETDFTTLPGGVEA
jgi:hypothetical protein